MRTTVDLTPEAYHLAKAIARDKKQSLGQTISDLITHQPPVGEQPAVTTDEYGFPSIRIGRPITTEEVNELIAED